MIRDQLECGVNDKDMREKLFQEKKLTLVKAHSIAITHEAAIKNAEKSIST